MPSNAPNEHGHGSVDPVQLINLTAHAVRLSDESGEVSAEIPPSGSVARLVERVGHLAGIRTDRGLLPTRDVGYLNTVEGLPDPSKGTAYIVSRVLAAAVPRDDLYFPGGEVRDEKGNISGCRYLGRFVHGQPDA